MFGRYRIEKLLGLGAFGEVYLVEHIYLKTNRALKCISKCHASAEFAHREADILKNLRHPLIPIIYDIEENDESVCIIEDYVEGMSLNSIIKSNHKFSIKEIIDISMQLCSAVRYLHSKGIYHQDIKAENIICNNGDIKLIDYGNAAQLGDRQSVRYGSRWYAAPETYDSKAGDERQDIYSIGVVMLMMATGKPDMDAIKRFPQAFSSVVAKCLAHQSIRRFGSVSKLENALSKIKNKSFAGNVSRRIMFVGAYPHCGTTHCARMTAEYFAATHKKVLLREINRSGDLINIIFESGKIRLDRGIFSVNDVHMLPENGGLVAWDFEKNYDVIIYDCGDSIIEAVNENVKADSICIVSGVRKYELKRLKESYEQAKKADVCEDENIYTLINFSDAESYVKALRTTKIINPIRVPYMPSVREKTLRKQGRLFWAENR